MDSEYIINKTIFSKLHHPICSDREYWSICIEKLDLGISYEPTSSVWLGDHRYRIVDEKKWLLAKLKYGF